MRMQFGKQADRPFPALHAICQVEGSLGWCGQTLSARSKDKQPHTSLARILIPPTKHSFILAELPQPLPSCVFVRTSRENLYPSIRIAATPPQGCQVHHHLASRSVWRPSHSSSFSGGSDMVASLDLRRLVDEGVQVRRLASDQGQLAAIDDAEILECGECFTTSLATTLRRVSWQSLASVDELLVQWLDSCEGRYVFSQPVHRGRGCSRKRDDVRRPGMTDRHREGG